MSRFPRSDFTYNSCLNPPSILIHRRVVLNDLVKTILACVAAALLWPPGLHSATITVNSTAQKPGSAGRSGGAISGSELGGGNPITITNSLFSGNTASTGGAIFAVSGVNATDSSFIGNSAFGEGGAIGTDGVQIFRCVFDGNSASGFGFDSRGGAIALSVLHPAVPGTIADSYFSNNSTSGIGGAISGAFKTTITRSTFTGNSAGTDGGAIGTGVNRILNSTFVNNTANRGGAGFIGEFLFHFFNNLTIVRNSANVAGGILVDSSTAFMANSVIAENTDLDGGGGQPDAEGSITDLGFNLVGLDPILGVLQDNGGPKVGANVGGLTPFTLPTIGPLAGSPVLGTGNPAASGSFPACEATDQRGFARNVGTCDKGAFEGGAGGGTVSTADLSLLASGTPDPTNRCGDITYLATASNAGPNIATAVTLTDTISGLAATLTSVTPRQGTCNTANFPAITCNLGELAAGSTAMVTIVVKPNDAGTITNQAGIDSAEDDPNSADNASSVSVTVRQRREPPRNQPGPPCWTSPPG